MGYTLEKAGLLANTQKGIDSLYKNIMDNCKAQRRPRTTMSSRQLAKALDISENYLSAFENSRKVPSIKLFLNYLKINGFDLQPLENLKVTHSKNLSPSAKGKITLFNEIENMDSEEIDFLTDMVKALKKFRSL